MKNQSNHYLPSSELNTFAGRKGRKRKEKVMQNLTSLYDHSPYGEAYDGMARHVSDMSNLDRIIFEDCDLSAGKVVAPHMNLKPYPHWLCPEYISRKIGCDLQDAANLLDCWVMLDPTHEMIETFISWVKVRGVEKARAYFEKLALALAEVENMDPDDVTEPPEPRYDAPDPYRYHVVGEYPEDDQETWLDNQPRWFRSLIASIHACNNLDRLSSFGKEAYQLSMDHDQAGVFWTEYNLRKAKLEAGIKLGAVAKVFIQKIARANGSLASLGAWLYKVQQGEIKVADAPAEAEWTVIWKAYQARKQQHDHACT